MSTDGANITLHRQCSQQPEHQLIRVNRGGKRLPNRCRSQLLKKLIDQFDQDELSYALIELQAGVARDTISEARRGRRNPNIVIVESLAEAAGYGLGVYQTKV